MKKIPAGTIAAFFLILAILYAGWSLGQRIQNDTGVGHRSGLISGLEEE